MPDLFSLLTPPDICLAMGVFLFSMAGYSTVTGKTSARFRWVYRAKEPVVFWLVVATYCLSGVVFIGIFLSSQAGGISKSVSP
jgi:hypothetical protein